jgi:hypothetical protein
LVALDYLFGRGLVDLDWSVAVVNSFPSTNEGSSTAKVELHSLLLLDQDESLFLLEQWAGGVYPKDNTTYPSSH